MRTFNKAVAVLGLVILFVVLPVIAVIPQEALKLLRDLLGSGTDLDNVARLAVAAVALLLWVIVIALLWLEFRPSRAGMVRVAAVEGGTALVQARSVERRLEQALLSLPSVQAAQARVEQARHGVAAKLVVDTDSDVNVPEVTASAIGQARYLLEKEVGASVGSITVRVGHVVPKQGRGARPAFGAARPRPAESTARPAPVPLPTAPEVRPEPAPVLSSQPFTVRPEPAPTPLVPADELPRPIPEVPPVEAAHDYWPEPADLVAPVVVEVVAPPPVPEVEDGAGVAAEPGAAAPEPEDVSALSVEEAPAVVADTGCGEDAHFYEPAVPEWPAEATTAAPDARSDVEEEGSLAEDDEDEDRGPESL